MIVEPLNDWYTRHAETTAQPFRIRPSNIGDCLRKLAWLQLGVEPWPLSPETTRTFELGHQRGARLEAVCKEIWPDSRTQVAVTIPLGRFEMKGSIDLWIPSLRTVIDFKTIGSFGAGLLPEEGVSDEYTLQIHAYREAMAEAEPSPQPVRAFVVYEAKDSDARKGVKAGQLIEQEVPRDADLEERYQIRLRELEGILIRHEQGTLDPTAYPELPLDRKGQKSYKCKHPYCSVGQERGMCYR